MRRLLFSLLLINLLSTAPIKAQEPNFELVEIIGRGRIDTAAWLPDGRLVVGGARGLWLYEAITANAEPQLIESPAGWIHSAAINGNTLATGHENGSVLLWDATTLTVTEQFTALAQPVLDLSFSADGTRLASGGDSHAQVWALADQTVLLDHPFAGSNEHLKDLLLSPDGGWLYLLVHLYSGDMDGGNQLDLIPLAEPAAMQRFVDEIGYYVGGLATSPDGRWLLLPSGNGLLVWDTTTATLIPTSYRDTLGSTLPFFMNDTLYLYNEFNLSSHAVPGWEEASNQYFEEPFIAEWVVPGDGWLALIGGANYEENENLQLWHLSSETRLSFAYDMAVQSITLEGDSIQLEHDHYAYDLCASEGSLIWQVYDPWEYANISGTLLQVGEQSVEVPYRITCALFNPEQTLILAGDEDGAIHFIDPATLQELGVWEHGYGRITLMQYAEDRLLVGTDSGLVYVWDVTP